MILAATDLLTAHRTQAKSGKSPPSIAIIATAAATAEVATTAVAVCDGSGGSGSGDGSEDKDNHNNQLPKRGGSNGDGNKR